MKLEVNRLSLLISSGISGMSLVWLRRGIPIVPLQAAH